MKNRPTSNCVGENLNEIKQQLDHLADNCQHTLCIPLAPPPPVPPSTSISLSLEEKQEYEKQGAMPKKQPTAAGQLRTDDTRQQSSSSNIYNKIESASSNPKIKSSNESLEEAGVIGVVTGKRTMSETEMARDRAGRVPRYISYFSSDLTLTNEERLQLVCDDYDCKLGGFS